MKYNKSEGPLAEDTALCPSYNVPNEYYVPNDTIVGIAISKVFEPLLSKWVEPLKGEYKRNWLPKHAYLCLPLVMASEVGFIIRAPFDIELLWSGGVAVSDLVVKIPVTQEFDRELLGQRKFFQSHFGSGVFTLNLPIQFRTPKGVSLYVTQPPNYYIDGLSWLSALVETDNLRHSFTFNIKVTRINETIIIKKGDPIAFVMPYPRYYCDQFQYKTSEDVGISEHALEQEYKACYFFGKERGAEIKGVKKSSLRYRVGVDIFGNKFEDHQRRVLSPAKARSRMKRNLRLQRYWHRKYCASLSKKS